MDGITSTALPVAMIGALCYTLVNFLRYLSAKEWKSAVSVLVLWVAGFGTIALLAATGYASSIVVFGMTLDQVSLWDKVLLGILASSILSPVKDLMKSLDNTQTATVPTWGGDPPQG